ncbi:MAG: DNA-methyltransferase [Clostridia bacterium]|jgi:DNA modification methylase|nr:site-specific DNA-methyltransferase [Clostridium sp.]DAE58917.1 MAG TPA: adenine-specific methyltransferase [Caudoviricetes sp.]
MEYNKVINGNSDDILEQFIEEGIKFDLICTDPPYNLNKDFGNNSDKLEMDEFLKITEERIEKCKKLLKPNGSIIWFGIHHYIGFIQTIMYKAGLFYRRMNIWHYENGFSRTSKAPLTQYEPFLWFSKSKAKWTYNVDDVRVPYKSTDRLKNPVYYKGKNGEKKIWQPNPNGAMRGDIWDFPTLAGKAFEKEKTPHPTQKPEALITEIIKAFCPKNSEGKYVGTILDPFHGSGTLGVCCEKLNREGHEIKWIGIELEEKWCKIANDRLKNI